jgi:hypothetical protein
MNRNESNLEPVRFPVIESVAIFLYPRMGFGKAH